MEREVGGGIGMGNTCKPMAVSFQCMTKSTTNKKKINKKNKKIKKMKIKKNIYISDISCGNLSFSLSALSVFPHLMVSFC